MGVSNRISAHQALNSAAISASRRPKQAADTLNDWVNGFLIRAAGLMSADNFEQLFWIQPGESFKPFEEEAFQALSQTMCSGSSQEFQDAKPL